MEHKTGPLTLFRENENIEFHFLRPRAMWINFYEGKPILYDNHSTEGQFSLVASEVSVSQLCSQTDRSFIYLCFILLLWMESGLQL